MISYYYHHSKYPVTASGSSVFTSTSSGNNTSNASITTSPHISISRIRNFSSNLANADSTDLELSCKSNLANHDSNLASSNSIRNQTDPTSANFFSKNSNDTSSDSIEKSSTDKSACNLLTNNIHSSNKNKDEKFAKSSSSSSSKNNMSLINISKNSSNLTLNETKVNVPIKLKRSKRDMSSINKETINLGLNQETTHTATTTNQEPLCQPSMSSKKKNDLEKDSSTHTTTTTTDEPSRKSKTTTNKHKQLQHSESAMARMNSNDSTSCNDEFTLMNDFNRNLYSRRSKRYVRHFKPADLAQPSRHVHINVSTFTPLTNQPSPNSMLTATASSITSNNISLSKTSDLNRLNEVVSAKQSNYLDKFMIDENQHHTSVTSERDCEKEQSNNFWNENFFLFNPANLVSKEHQPKVISDKTLVLTSKDITLTTNREQDTTTAIANDLSFTSIIEKKQHKEIVLNREAEEAEEKSTTNISKSQYQPVIVTTTKLNSSAFPAQHHYQNQQQQDQALLLHVNETTQKDLMTLNEFLKEFQIKNNTSGNNSNNDLMEKKEESSKSHRKSTDQNTELVLNHEIKKSGLKLEKQHSTSSTTSSSSSSSSSESSSLSSSPSKLTMNSNSSTTSSLSLLSSQMMSSSSSLLDTNSKKLVISRSKKLGQILKLASVRGVKSKSLKHKFTNQLQQQKHSFISFEIDTNCHVCQKSLHEKKALHCKNCLLTVHDEPYTCQNELILCNTCKPPRQNSSLSISAVCSNSQTLKSTSAYSSSSLENKTEQSILSNNKYNTNKPESTTTTSNSTTPANSTTTTTTSNSSQLFKQNLFARERPKSMDITKYFQAHLSKSTSHIMYSKSNSNNDDNQDTEIVKSSLRESIDCLHFKFDENSIQSSNSTLSTFFRTTLTNLNKEFYKYDTDFSANNWADLQTNEFLNTLNKQTRNRQENIFEFVKTEVNYLKILNITQNIYMNAMQDECKIEQKLLHQMFPDLGKLISLHKTFVDLLVQKYQQCSNKFIDSIGNILLETFTSKQELLIELYGKVCCSHLSAKSMYKQLSSSNKQFVCFLQECRKYPMLRRYEIPDCLLIITQRLTKYLTLIESLIGNSKDEKKDTDLLVLVLERLKLVLRKVNDTVAFHQNSTEFKKIFDLIDPKSFTFAYFHSLTNASSNSNSLTKSSFKDNTLSRHSSDLQKRVTKADLIIPHLCSNGSTTLTNSNSNSSNSNSSGIAHHYAISNSPSIKSSSSSSSLSSLSSSSSAYTSEQRKIISINQVYVKYMSNNSKIYKDVTCLTMSDMIVFLQLNEKGKLIFMNENSVIPCTTGILVRPKLDELLSNRSANFINNNSPTTNSNLTFSNTTTTNNSLNNTNSSINGLTSITITTTNNNNSTTNTNSVYSSQNNSTTGANTSNSSTISNGVTFLNSSSSNIYSYIVNTITNEIVELKFPEESSRNQWATLVHTHITPLIGGDNSTTSSQNNHNSSNNSNVTKEETQQTAPLSSSSTTTTTNQPSSTPTSAPSTPTALSKDSPSTSQPTKPSQSSNAFRCNSNVSTNSSILSSGHGSLTQESIISSESSSSSSSSSSNSSKKASNKTAKDANDLQLSSDLTSLLYSFNGILEQSLFSNHNGNLIMRSASSAGETVTKYNTDIAAHLSIPKRAETFNGISKDNQIDSVNLNADLVSKSRTYKNSIDLSDVKPYLVNDSHNSTSSSSTTASNSSKQSNGINSSSFSADSGLCCADLNQDIIDVGSNCSSLSLEQLNHAGECTLSQQKSLVNTRINKTQLESILRFILNDYLRLKTENESLHKELELKNKSIDMLKSTMNECKDQLDFEKLNLQKKFNELDLKKEVKK